MLLDAVAAMKRVEAYEAESCWRVLVACTRDMTAGQVVVNEMEGKRSC